jgi:photosystem II stability/assembly factor-like uncharacterized protein
MKIKKYSWLLVFSLLFLGGCSVTVNNQGAAGKDLGGIFVSDDKGNTWRNLSGVSGLSGQAGSVAGIDIKELFIDPEDSAAVYMATFDEGLYFTYNVTNGWQKANGLPKTTINDVAIDPKAKCTIYAAANNKLYKSTDCARSFLEIYYDNNSDVKVTAVAIDGSDTRDVYIGTSRGEIIKSLDAGTSWRTIQRLNDGVRKIIINPKNNNLVLIASVKTGLYLFDSGAAKNLEELADYKNKFDGSNWTDLNGELREFDLGFNFKGLVFSGSDNSLFLATDKVLLKSLDGGHSWTKIKLITPDKETNINSIAVNPKNSQEIYYVTNTTFYKSVDGGSSWITKELPTTRAGQTLLVDFDNPNNIYLGVMKIKK